MAVLALSAAACTGDGAGSGSSKSTSIVPPPSTTSSASAHAKYTALPTCREVTQRMPGLPPFRSGNEKPLVSDLLAACEFQRIPDWPRVNLKVSAWRDENGDISFPAGPGRGALKAREAYDVTSKPGADPADDGAAEDVEVGEKAKWLTPKDKGSCTLVILDANAVLVIENKPADKPEPRSQECRGPLRELAKSFYDAVRMQ
ncbi:hypothetical protein [Nocardia sp. NRRL S-836]|uniref:hypothetical protein n=1 Tax=Nocardia sp. NRRL S-836 TaxID=1519492 RepID=UPI0012F96385|nr:hypothetical protein [Nocardia sp. NRRL S-836]